MATIATKILVGSYYFILSTYLLHAHGGNVEQLQQKDPLGIVLTLTAISVVFAALILLVLVFKLLGGYLNKIHNKSQLDTNKTQTLQGSQNLNAKVAPEVMAAIALSITKEQMNISDETVVAISMALHSYLNNQHDFVESYKLTIRHRPTLWNYKGQCLRQYP